MVMNGKLFTVGKIANTHGIRGELKIIPQTDFAEERFAVGSELVIVDAKALEVPVTVQSARLHKEAYIIKFKQFNEINEVEKYKGTLIKIDAKHQKALDEGEYYYHEIRGCKVVTDEGQELGEITDILSPGANDVWVVTLSSGKELLLPVIDEVVLNVDVKAKRVTVHLMEGLMSE
jgi:16S rRNA processing protein RimM